MIWYKEDELQHDGTKGMHWGIRLYQYKDGTLTPLGRARARANAKKYAKYANRYKTITGKKVTSHQETKKEDTPKPKTKTSSTSETDSKNSSQSTKPKTLNEMTNEEIQQKINRMNLEIQYRQKYEYLNPTKVSKGKEFAQKAVKNTSDALLDAGKKAATAYLEKKFKEALRVSNNNRH